MNDVYEAVMRLEDGRVLRTTGNIMQCSNWADNMIRIYGGCRIDIKRIEVTGGA